MMWVWHKIVHVMTVAWSRPLSPWASQSLTAAATV